MNSRNSKHWFDPIIKLELYTNWTLGRANLVLQAAQFWLLLTLHLDTMSASILVAGGTLAAVILGWWGVERQKLLARQTSVANAHNPELLLLGYPQRQE